MLPNLTDRTLLIVGALLCGIAAWYTIGYHHPDEHFQIWEFANYKLRHIPASELPWEFPAQMRPGLQPFLAYSLVVTAQALGIDNPFVQVFLARLICGIAALTVYWHWVKWLERDFKSPETARWMRLGLLFFWLMPYLHVRFSSENTSAICFFGGLLLLLRGLETHSKRLDWKMVGAGLLLGLSFFFRYQIAFAGIGLGAWLLFKGRPSIQQWIALASGALIALGLGLVTDHWLYGEWVFAPYNYFFSNIMEGKAANFGVSPFWWYLTEMPIALLPPLSLVLLFFCALGIWEKPWHVLSWCVVPFVLAHSLVGHKEVRFLFPMAMPFFFFAAFGWEIFREKFQIKNWMTKAIGYCFGLNLAVMVFRIFIPAKEMVAYYKFLWGWANQHPESTIYFIKKEPKKNYPLNMPFYNHPNQNQADWFTDPALKNDTSALKPGDLMLITDATSPATIAPSGFQLKHAYAYYPDWILANNTNNWQDRTRIWTVYSLEKAE
jgi:phosphatidylinositol glycan class B